MFHHIENVTDTAGNVQPGWSVDCYVAGGDPATATAVTIYADRDATLPVPGNRVQADSDKAFVSFYIASGLYGRRYYDTSGVMRYSVDGLDMYGSDNADASAASAVAAAAQAATATTQAGIATTQAATSTAQAVIATTQAGNAATSAANASLYEAAAQAFASGNLFANTTDPLTYGVSSLVITGNGTSGTNGTFAGSYTGGGGTGAAFSFVVSGGAVVPSSIVITNKGTGYTSDPTPVFSASAGLTGVTATLTRALRTTAGDYLLVVGTGNIYASLYKNVAGAITYQTLDLPSKAMLDALSASVIKQGGFGSALITSGPGVTKLDNGLSRAVITYTMGADGLTYTPIEWINTARNLAGFRTAEVERSITFKQADTPDSGQYVLAGSVMASPKASTRWAWGCFGYLGVDTVDGVILAPGAVRASEGIAANGIVKRGNTLGIAKTTWRSQAELGSVVPVIRQGSALAAYASVNSGGLRTHQEVPSVTRVGNWLYAVWYALNGTLGSATNEALGNYLVVARRALTGSTWTEIAQIIPSDMATTRYYDPVVTEDNGRIAILWATTCKMRNDSYSLGTSIYHYATGCWGVILENPETASGGRFDFGKPRFLEYGVPSTPFKANGSLHLPIDVWRNGTYIGASFELPNRYPDVGGAGSRLCRMTLSGSGAPYVERLSVMPGTTSGDESYSETQAVMLDGGSWLAFRRTIAGIKSLTASADLGGTTADWTGPTDATALTSMTTASRCALIRTAMGNLAFVGNTSGRTDMYLRLSADEGTTMGYSKQLVTGSTYEVSYPSAVSWIDSATSRAKIGMVWDRGRGAGSSYPADIVWCEVFEDEIIAGTATVTTSNISSL